MIPRKNQTAFEKREEMMATISQGTRAAKYFDAYQSYHHHPMNELTHYVGIPVIVVSIAGLLSYIALPYQIFNGVIGLDFGLGMWIIATLFYLWLDPRIGIPFSAVMLGFYICGRQLMYSEFWPVLWVMFIGGWIVQFIGHYRYEKQSPAFYKNIEHLLVGPFWIFAKMVGYYR